MLKLLGIPVAAIVLAVPLQKPASTPTPPPIAPGTPSVEAEVPKLDLQIDPMVEELIQMQKELQGLRQQAMMEALQELEEVDARIAELEEERNLILDRIARIEEQCAAPTVFGAPYGTPRSGFPAAL